MSLKKYRVKNLFHNSIEPEEILMDAAKSGEFEDQRIEIPIEKKTFRAFYGIILAILIVLAGRAAWLQLAEGGYFKELAEHNRVRAVPVFASRGIIYDRSMKQLVFNIPSFDLMVSPADLPRSQAEKNAVIEKAANLLGVPAQEIADEIKNFDLRSSPSISIVQNLEHEKLMLLEPNLEELPGFRIAENTVRRYVDAPVFSHIIGYLGKLGTDEAKDNPDYFSSEKIGKDGLEFFYEKTLRGQPGERIYEVDSKGKQKRELAQNPSRDGQGLVLTIDYQLQGSLYQALSRKLASLGLKKGAAVALDPQTGGILALVSFPSFDSNAFAQGLSSKIYSELANNPAQPLFNRAVSGQYAPGSTIKPLVAAAALKEDVISPLTKIFDSGELVLTSQYTGQVTWRFGDWKAHGAVDMYSAIAQSCDVYFYTIGGGYGNIKGLGIDRLEQYFKLFGLGSKLGIDLPGEETGLVPGPEWKEQKKNEQWYIGDTYHISIGQGDLLVTPLQLAAATASLLNGGKIIQPHLVDKFIDSDKNVIKINKPQILREGFVGQEELEVVRNGMRQTVTSGSALLLNNLPVQAGAKTGTAQVAGQHNSNAWGTVFAPYENPEIVLVVLAENAGEGSQVAIPVAKEVLETYFAGAAPVQENNQ